MKCVFYLQPKVILAKCGTQLNSAKYVPSSHLANPEAYSFSQSWCWSAVTQSRLLVLIASCHPGSYHSNAATLNTLSREQGCAHNQRWLLVALIFSCIWEQEQNSGMWFIAVKKTGFSMIKDDENSSVDLQILCKELWLCSLDVWSPSGLTPYMPSYPCPCLIPQY